MPSAKAKDAPEKLRGYLFHGLDLEWESDASSDVVGDCPFCGKEGRFYVSRSTGQFSCKTCTAEGEGSGNLYTFLNLVKENSPTPDEDYESLTAERQVSVETLKLWGVFKSCIDDKWYIPAYNEKGKLANLYRWARIDGRWRAISTSTCNHHLFGFHLWNPKAADVYICEGPWDGMKFYETVAGFRRGSGVFVKTSAENSLLKNANIVAVPGCEQFRDKWATTMSGKNVHLLYDNDHPRTNMKTGKVSPPAGHMGMKRASEILTAVTPKVKSIQYVKWGEGGYDETLKSGYDVRDLLSNGQTKSKALAFLFERLSPVPESWVKDAKTTVDSSPPVEASACSAWLELQDKWKKALKWTQTLDQSLLTILAVVASTKSKGNQLWLRVIGPPGSAKTTLCEAITVSENNVIPISIQRGFHSGYVGAEGKDDDASLIPQMDRKATVIKDADTLITSPCRDQTLGEMRDFWDGVARARYKNRVVRVYKNLRMTFILAGTSTIRKLNKAAAGDRFLDIVVHHRDGLKKDDEIALHAAYAELRSLRAEEDADAVYDEKLMEAMSFTGGYVDWLGDNASTMLRKITVTDDDLITCSKLAKIIGFMRARPDKDNEEDEPEVELHTRLSRQLVRMATCLVVVQNKQRIDDYTWDILFKITADTSKGLILSIAKRLYDVPAGLEVKTLEINLGKDEKVIRKYLRFMKDIGMAHNVPTKLKDGRMARYKNKWTLVPEVRRLFSETIAKKPYIVEEDATA